MADLGNKKGYCSIKKLSEYLNTYKIYEGDFNIDNDSWHGDKYLYKQNIFIKSYKIIELFTSLFIRFFKGLILR